MSAGRFGFEFVRSHYGVPAKRGGRVTFRGVPGRLTSGAGHYVRVRLDGEEHSIIVHPTWEMVYLDTESALQRTTPISDADLADLASLDEYPGESFSAAVLRPPTPEGEQ